MSKHTNGPWLLVEKDHTRGTCESHPHLEYFHIQGPQGDLDPDLCIAGFMKRSDAKLIVAAPELRVALTSLLAFVEGECGSIAEDDCNVLAAYAALAKAES